MNKFISMLGLARKAGKLAIGYDAVRESLFKHSARLVIFTCDVSDRSFNKVKLQAMHNGLPFLKIREKMSTTEFMFGKKISVMSVNDDGFAKKLIKLEETVYGDKI